MTYQFAELIVDFNRIKRTIEMMMKDVTTIVGSGVIMPLLGMVSTADVVEQDTITMSKSVLMDKLKGHHAPASYWY